MYQLLSTGLLTAVLATGMLLTACQDILDVSPVVAASADAGTCADGYQGNGTTCVDIDECDPREPTHDCNPNASCSNTPGSYMCTCNAGFVGDGVQCARPTSCSELGQLDPGAPTGIHTIDIDGNLPMAELDVYCDMGREGGGWTLVLVSSDDGQATWTMDNRTLMTTDTRPIGSLDAHNRDFKSPAYHALLFRDVLFVHQPSGLTAEYEGVGDGTQSFDRFLGAIPYPVCDLSQADDGHPQTGGTLVLTEPLCDTDLYFNLGDHESAAVDCNDLSAAYNNATFGPTWSRGNNYGCPFDDPSSSGLGPNNQCGQCPTGTSAQEANTRGFGTILGLDTGMPGMAENLVQLFIR
ncbi:MAG: calcium-binding protein [Proteobacteria bacterium]|nr:calcium-binding protein [Pseudomonadota bacterium]